MTTYDSQTTVTIGGTDYSGQILRGVRINMGRDDLTSQPKAGFVNVELWDDWDTAYTFDINSPIVVSIYNQVTATQQTIFSGKVAEVNVSTYDSGVRGGIALHQITGVGPLAEINRQTYNQQILGVQYLPGEYIDDILEQSYSTTWNDLGDQYTWDDYPGTIRWIDLLNSGPVGTIDNGGFSIPNVVAGETNALTLIQDIASWVLGVFSEGGDGLLYFRDLLYRDTLTPVAIDATDIINPDLNNTSKLGNIVNAIETTNHNDDVSSLRDDDSIVTYGVLEASRTVQLDEFPQNYYPYSPLVGFVIAAQYLNQIILTAKSTPYAYPDNIRIQLENPSISNALREDLIGVFVGMYLTIDNLPGAFIPDNGMNNDGIFHAFVEGWTWNLTDKQAELTLNLSDYRNNYFAQL